MNKKIIILLMLLNINLFSVLRAYEKANLNLQKKFNKLYFAAPALLGAALLGYWYFKKGKNNIEPSGKTSEGNIKSSEKTPEKSIKSPEEDISKLPIEEVIDEKRNTKMLEVLKAARLNFGILNNELKTYQKEVFEDMKPENIKIDGSGEMQDYDKSKYFIEKIGDRFNVYRYLIDESIPFYVHIAEIEDKKIDLVEEGDDQIQYYVFEDKNFRLSFSKIKFDKLTESSGVGLVNIFFKKKTTNKEDKKDQGVEKKIIFIGKRDPMSSEKFYLRTDDYETKPEKESYENFINAYNDPTELSTSGKIKKCVKKMIGDCLDFHLEHDTKIEEDRQYKENKEAKKSIKLNIKKEESKVAIKNEKPNKDIITEPIINEVKESIFNEIIKFDFKKKFDETCELAKINNISDDVINEFKSYIMDMGIDQRFEAFFDEIDKNRKNEYNYFSTLYDEIKTPLKDSKNYKYISENAIFKDFLTNIKNMLDKYTENNQAVLDFVLAESEKDEINKDEIKKKLKEFGLLLIDNEKEKPIQHHLTNPEFEKIYKNTVSLITDIFQIETKEEIKKLIDEKDSWNLKKLSSIVSSLFYLRFNFLETILNEIDKKYPIDYISMNDDEIKNVKNQRIDCYKKVINMFEKLSIIQKEFTVKDYMNHENGNFIFNWAWRSNRDTEENDSMFTYTFNDPRDDYKEKKNNAPAVKSLLYDTYAKNNFSFINKILKVVLDPEKIN